MYDTGESPSDYYQYFNWSWLETAAINEDGQYDWSTIYEHPNGQSTFESEYERFFKYQHTRRLIYGFLLISLIIIGIIGNVFVIVTSIRKSKRVNSAFYIFLVNLSAASLVLLVFEYPLLLYENVFNQPWKMGEFFCQLHGYIQYCAFYGVAYALVIVLVFRLLQITIPDKLSSVNNTCAALAVCVIKWVVIMVANVPTWIGHGLYDEIEGNSFCYHKQLNESKAHLYSYLILHFLCAFIIPVVIMVVISTLLILSAMKMTAGSVYSNVMDSAQLQRNTTIMLLSLIVAFIVCWAPSNVFIILLGFDYFDHDNFFTLSILSDVFMALACTNPSLNPWLIFLSLRKELLSRGNRATANANGTALDSNSVQNESTCNASEVTTDFTSTNDQVAFVTDIEMDSTPYPHV